MSVSGTKEVDKTILLISEKRTDGRRRRETAGRASKERSAEGRKEGRKEGREGGRSGRKEAETTERRGEERRGGGRG